MPTTTGARERILDAAAHQYYADGIRAASADKLIAEAGVSKVTFYRHFPTKDALVVAYLEHAAERERDQVTATIDPADPAAVLRGYAQGISAVTCAPGFRGCPFINAAAELSDPDHPGRAVVAEHRAWLVARATDAVRALGLSDPALRAERLMMLRDGAMVAGYVGRDPQAVHDDLVAAGRAVLS